ncbi:unnamed protein product [Cylicocyclus nassatus]|uniref:Integrase-type domain-containing protein n=1 Tax=Cylicocyclus nassatus TaxID=53992 RepID=A0AA36DRY3_CYLNA|nr:unnamed protein product [Cylicocyclus nassatus]
MRERMKASYDREKGVESCPAPPKVGDRVYMRIPSEKQSSSHPKLANPWEGPYRVIEASENSALITLINQDKEPVRVPFDLLRKLPRGISDEPLLTRKSRAAGSPYEDRNAEEWRRVGEVCREFVRFLTDPSRNFLAVTRDHYSGVLDHAPYTHLACCLGVNPRRSGAPFIGPQILTFLEKVRITVNDLIRLPKFEPATPELREQRRREKVLKARRRKEEYMPNFWVIADPQKRRHRAPITFEDPSQAPNRRNSPNRHHRSPSRHSSHSHHTHGHRRDDSTRRGGM